MWEQVFTHIGFVEVYSDCNLLKCMELAYCSGFFRMLIELKGCECTFEWLFKDDVVSSIQFWVENY